MADFEQAVELVLKHEGGYTAGLAGDPGGETNFGISKRAYPQLDIKNLTVEQAKEIYKRDYWTQAMELISTQSLANCLLDAAVNQGAKACQDMQDRAGALFGTVTLAKFQVERLLAYVRLNKPQFYKSWFNRTLDV